MGRPKAGLELGGKPLIHHVLETASSLCREIILVTSRITEFVDFGHKIVRDLAPGQGPLGGLASGLFYARYPLALTLACDLPFLQVSLLARLAREASNAPAGPMVVVPRTSSGWEPLVAVYSKDCLPIIQKLLAGGRRKLEDLRTTAVRWREIPENELRVADPDLRSFINVNTPGDLERARAVIKERSEAGCGQNNTI